MKALSVHQPWAWLIVNGYKDVENRTWRTTFRGRIYIHAGLKPDKSVSAYELMKDKGGIPWEQYRRLHNMHFEALGCIVGEVEIVDCLVPGHMAQTHRWYEGPYGFLLSDPVAYSKPIPYKGQLGFFEVDLTLWSG